MRITDDFASEAYMSDGEHIEGTRAELIAELETIKAQELAEGYTEDEDDEDY